MQPEFKKATDAVGVAELITLSQNPESCLSSDFFPPKKYFFCNLCGNSGFAVIQKIFNGAQKFFEKKFKVAFFNPCHAASASSSSSSATSSASCRARNFCLSFE